LKLIFQIVIIDDNLMLKKIDDDWMGNAILILSFLFATKILHQTKGNNSR